MAVGAGGDSEQRLEVVSHYGGTALLDAVAAQVAAARTSRDYPLWRAALFCASNLVRFRGPEGDGFRRRLLDHGAWAGCWLAAQAAGGQVGGWCSQAGQADAAQAAGKPLTVCWPACPPSARLLCSWPGLEAELLIAQASKDAHVKAVALQAEGGLEAFDAWQRHCYRCGAAEAPGSGGEHKICGGCKSRVFCSRECLKAAWAAGHRAECKLLAPL